MTEIRTRLDATPGSAREDAERRASVALILRESDSTAEVEMFLIRRALHEADPWSGHMAFPGGRFEPEDSGLDITAIRETDEETGLIVPPESCIGRLDDVQGRSRGRSIGLVISCYVFEPGAASFVEPTHNEEVAASFWVPLSVLADPANHIRYVPPRQGAGEFPGVRISENPSDIVWGLTWRFICDFAVRIGHRFPESASEIG